MGNGQSIPAPVALQAPGLCVFGRSELVAPESITLVMKENMWNLSGNTFDIKDTDGKKWFQCKGAAFNHNDKKTLYDANGTPVWIMKKKMMSLYHTQHIYFADGNTLLFDISTKSMMSVQSHLQATVSNTLVGNKIRVTLEGTWRGYDACVYLGDVDKGGQPVARVSRRAYNVTQTNGDSQAYHLEVAAGVDMALVLSLVLAWDEEKNERK